MSISPYNTARPSSNPFFRFFCVLTSSPALKIHEIFNPYSLFPIPFCVLYVYLLLLVCTVFNLSDLWLLFLYHSCLKC